MRRGDARDHQHLIMKLDHQKRQTVVPVRMHDEERHRAVLGFVLQWDKSAERGGAGARTRLKRFRRALFSEEIAQFVEVTRPVSQTLSNSGCVFS